MKTRFFTQLQECIGIASIELRPIGLGYEIIDIASGGEISCLHYLLIKLTQEADEHKTLVFIRKRIRDYKDPLPVTQIEQALIAAGFRRLPTEQANIWRREYA